jgi:GNAT superfamily N-acetyltransferase
MTTRRTDDDAWHVRRSELSSQQAQELIAALNAELSAAYPEPGANHFRLDPDEVSGDRGAFVIVSHAGEPVACGALRRLDAGTAELKRMFVRPEWRRKGCGRRLLAALEAEANRLRIRRLVLETGKRQTAALGLYRSSGFTDMPPYGEYLASPGTSVCMQKVLDPGPTSPR